MTAVNLASMTDKLVEEMQFAGGEERVTKIKELFPKLKVTITNIGEERNAIGTNYKYRVTITNEGKRMSVTFHDSVANYKRNEEPNMLEVIYSVVQDADSYENCESVEDFASEFGYVDLPFATSIYKACQKEHDSLVRVFGEEGYAKLWACTRGY